MKIVEQHYETSSELELELGLSLGASKPKTASSQSLRRILTAKDFPCVSGTKRNADSVTPDPGSSPPRTSQVVGWPPIRASRIQSLVSQAKSQRYEEDKMVISEKEITMKKTVNTSNAGLVMAQRNLGFVKVNVDGIAIGRKVDLNSHSSYESLAQTLEGMFFRSGPCGEAMELGAKASKLLDGSSEFVLTYEDKDDDWILVGDVPWRMFLSSVKRLRIMRTSEVNRIPPRFQERNERQRVRPI